MHDPASLQHYIIWVAANGSNRGLTWSEIKEFDIVDQHDFAILSRIYAREIAQIRAEKKQLDEIKKATADSAKGLAQL